MRIKKFIFIIIAGSFLSSAMAQNAKNSTDHFAQIGNRVQGTRLHLLEDKLPPVLPDIYLPKMQGKKNAFKPIDKVDTPEELKRELAKLREKFVPYMADYAPQMEQTRDRLMLDEFQWRVGTAADLKDFGNVLNGSGEWTTVQIPHYGPPVGPAITYYRKTFKLSDKMLKYENQFIRFKGVDYWAEVYINGALVGSHEGFFAPFEFNITPYLNQGENVLLVKVRNDFTTLGSFDGGNERKIGNKIYAASGLGWDNPDEGWHTCPAGMGIYQECYIESRNALHINEVFVRPLLEEEMAEVWLEVNNFHEEFRNIKLNMSIFGQNFPDTVLQNVEYIPSTTYIPGVGDLAKPQDWEKSRLPMGYGVNYLKVKLPVKSPRLWTNNTPWLYQLQVSLFAEDGTIADNTSAQFGMRSFTQDTLNSPKGQMYLNGDKIRLRGANTMGFLQQDVKQKKWKQLIDDILLAKACNMNFIRLTQRPVQAEIYDYCDRLGMMLQTDLPMFGSHRPNLFAEAVKQSGEMERLVRNHPSNIMVTYMNERFPNGEGHPQRSMATAEEYYRLFKACDQMVHHWNPDRVIKAGDGDYDPPSPGLPDNHCYNTWYNGHALGLGELHKGYWQKVKPNWYYACGEFGAEAFDNYETVKKYWPTDWIPQNENEAWIPNKVVKAQTYRFHYMWYPTQETLQDWIDASQEHQAWATRLVTEAFRRDTNMVSFAIHLFIDAWPAGWMKAIMDVDRKPKKAFFAYRDALAPLMVNLRTDRTACFSNEEIPIEAWLCNDNNSIPDGYSLKWQLERQGKVIKAAQTTPKFLKNSSKFQGYIKFNAPEVKKRTAFQIRLALFNEQGEGVSESVINIDAFPRNDLVSGLKVFAPVENEKATLLLKQLNIDNLKTPKVAKTVLIDNYLYYEQNRKMLDQLVEQGSTLVFLELPEGEYKIAENNVGIEKTIMGEYYFVSPKTNHPMVKDAKPFDFSFWYDDTKGLVRPLLSSMVNAGTGWNPVLKTGKTSWVDVAGEYAAVAEMKKGKGAYRICQVQLNNRIKANPVAKNFAIKLLSK